MNIVSHRFHYLPHQIKLVLLLGSGCPFILKLQHFIFTHAFLLNISLMNEQNINSPKMGSLKGHDKQQSGHMSEK